jgi:hypothetical protein
LSLGLVLGIHGSRLAPQRFRVERSGLQLAPQLLLPVSRKRFDEARIFPVSLTLHVCRSTQIG